MPKSSQAIGCFFVYPPMTPLFIRMVRIGIRFRTAVSKSMPTMPKAASPITLTASQSGLANFAPMISPRDEPRGVDFPQPT